MEGMTVAEAGSKLGWADVAVIACYFVCVLAVGLYTSWRSQRGSVSGYFLASRDMHWLPVGASLFASNIGSGHFIGLAGSGAASGTAVTLYEQGSIYTIMMLGWLFVPVYMAAGVYTMPEYLRLRFGGQRIRVYLSFLALLLYIFTKISADLYAGALFIQLALNKSSAEWLYLSILFLLVVAAAFTIAGGLTAVVWTDFVQTVLMVLGALVLMALSLKEVGGFQGLVEKFPLATAEIRGVDGLNKSCGEPPEDYMNFIRSSTPGVSNYPWVGMIFGLRINSLWYWCTDQVIVQRTLASKNLSHAKAGCIVACYLKFLPLWLLILPGMAARILFPDRVACASPEECLAICGSRAGCSNIAYPELVINLLPPGLAGLMLAVMMAALMTSLTSIFNSASTIFTLDVWMLVRGKCCSGAGRCCGGTGVGRPTDRELLVVGRVFVVILVAISVIWIPVIQNTGNSQLFDYIQSISSFLAPPIAAVFLLAVFWPRATEAGAFWGLMAGLVIGLLRFILQFSYVVPPCGSGELDLRPWVIRAVVGGVHYLHFSLILCFLTGLVTVTVSLMTPPIPRECLYRLTFWSRKETAPRRPLDSPRHPSPSQETEMNGALNSGEEEGKKGMEEEEEEEEERRRKEGEEAVKVLIETPNWRRIVNWNAVICLTISTFVIGFFA